MPATPGIEGVLETALYYTDEQATVRFYEEVLGLKLIGHVPGRHVFFRCGPGVLLLFNADETRQAGSLPAHGAKGQGHVCFVVGDGYEEFKRRMMDRGVEIIQETHWPPGSEPPGSKGSSFYLRDPSGNLLEIANTDFWPR